MTSLIPSSITLTLITYYPRWYRGKLQSIKHTDKIRGDLALDFIHKSQKAGYQIVIVDGRSSNSFRRELAGFENVHVINRRNVKRSPSRRQGFKIATKLPGVQVIVVTEPEKISLLENLPALVKPILGGSADIVIPKREPVLFQKTYPGFQFESEKEGNILYNEYLTLFGFLPNKKEELDLFFGPRIFRNERKTLSLFLKHYYFRIGSFEFRHEFLDPEELSNAMFFPIILALKRGLKVKSVEIPFSYPALQKENEESGNRELFEEKRRSQRLGLLVELMHFINYLENRPHSRLIYKTASK